MRELALLAVLSFALTPTGCRAGCRRASQRGDDAAPDPSAGEAGPARPDAADSPPPPPAPWGRTFGGPGADEALALALGAEGEVYVGGRFAGVVDFDPGASARQATSQGGSDAFLAAYSALGVLRWVVTFGGPGDDAVLGLAPDRSGAGVLVAGSFEGNVDLDPGPAELRVVSGGATDAFLVRFDGEGALRWARTWGGAQQDAALGVGSSSDSATLVGSFSGELDLDPGEPEERRRSAGETDAFVVQLDLDGGYRWGRTLGGPGADAASAVTSDEDGAVALCGWFSEALDLDPGGAEAIRRSEGFTDLFVLALSREGEPRWSWALGGPLVDQGLAIARGLDRSLWVAGFFVDEVTVETEPDETVLRSAGRSDALVLRLAEDGRPLWASAFGGEASDYAYGVAASPGGGVLLTGRFSGTLAPDRSATGQELTARGAADAYVLALTESAALRWARGLGGAGLDRGSAVLADGVEAFLVVGAFQGELELPLPAASVERWRSRGASDAFVARLSPGGD